METHQRLRQLLDERGWTEYRLSKECGLSESTLANIFRRNTMPTISTLEAICKAFGITMSQFFAEGDMVEMTPQLKELFDIWVTLTLDQKAAVLNMIKVFGGNYMTAPSPKSQQFSLAAAEEQDVYQTKSNPESDRKRSK